MANFHELVHRSGITRITINREINLKNRITHSIKMLMLRQIIFVATVNVITRDDPRRSKSFDSIMKRNRTI